jgi:hypothetical protein
MDKIVKKTLSYLVFSLFILAIIIAVNFFINYDRVEGAITYTADGNRVPPTALISSAQDLTAVWADLGSEIQTDKYRWLKIWIQLDINNGANVRIRILEKTALAGSIEYVQAIETVGTSDLKIEDLYYEFNVDADQNVVLLVELRNTVPVCQVQVQAGTAGAPTAAQIDSALYSSGK